MSPSVKRRETFYLSGYDPRGARHYYNLYKNEAQKQSKVNGLDFHITKRKRTNAHMQSWAIETHSEEKVTQTSYHFLEWDDIMRAEWKQSILSLVMNLIFYVKTYLFSGRFKRYWYRSPGQMIAIFSPFIFVVFSTLLSILFGMFIGYVSSPDYQLWLGILSTMGMLYFLLTWGEKWALFWLLRVFVFSGRYVFETMPKLESRLEFFASHLASEIEKTKENNIDEVLIVAHSVGSILLIPLLEKVLKRVSLPKEMRLSVLVLGECIPLVIVIDEATEYKRKMDFIAQSDALFWLDYTSIIDGATFPCLNYFEDNHSPLKYPEYYLFLSTRFHTLFTKEIYKKIRRNKYKTHFLYLMSTEQPGAYDYFKMTAGHEPLSNVARER